MHKRRHLVDWVCVKAELLHLSRVTVHLGVRYVHIFKGYKNDENAYTLSFRILDFFMDNFSIEQPQLYAVALTSASLLAAKLEHQTKYVSQLPSRTSH